MVILKISAGTDAERKVEIVNEKGTWQSGSYLIFAAAFLNRAGNSSREPHNVSSPSYLGEIYVDKEKGQWQYRGEELLPDGQEEIAKFILDYKAPDGVY